jgi:hypothetical protein
MFYRVIQKNTLLPFVLLPFFLVLAWGKLLFFTEGDAISHDMAMPLFDMLNEKIKGHTLIASLITLFMAFWVMFGLNRFNSRYVLLKKQSMITGILYLIIVSGYTYIQQLHPVWFFVPLMVIAIDKLFKGASVKEASVHVFNATFLVTLGSLFYGKAIYFVPMVWMIMILLNIFTLRNFLASLLGLITPLAITFGVYLVINQQKEVINLFIENLLTPSSFFNHTIYSKVYNGIIVAFILFSTIVLLSKINQMKILTRKLNRVFVWIVIYALLLAATPFFSMEIIPVIALGAAYLLAHYFESLKKAFWQELIFTILIGVTVALQLLM